MGKVKIEVDFVPCPVEVLLLLDGWVLTRDGRAEKNDGSCQFPSPPKDRRFFKRVLKKKKKDGKFSGSRIELIYDLRNYYCVDVKVFSEGKDGNVKKQILKGVRQ